MSKFVNPFPFRTWLDSVLDRAYDETGCDEFFYNYSESEWERLFNRGMAPDDAALYMLETSAWESSTVNNLED